MGLRRYARWACLAVTPALIVAISGMFPSRALAQGNGGGGTSLSGIAGVIVDADGTLKVFRVQDETGRLTDAQKRAAIAALPGKVGNKSALRYVSLNRLEKAIAGQLEGNRRPTDEMLYLAGLQRIQYVFFYPDSGDIVIAGPAEGWYQDLAGRMMGVSTGRPVVELQDLVVALRLYGPGQNDMPVIGCSIDPTQEGLANMQNFLRQLGGRFDPRNRGQIEFIVEGLRTSLGLQNVRVLGVPPDTHFAQVMVEADYRMKLIGIGLERPAVALKSFVDGAEPAQVSRNALQRWYFTPNYQCVRVSEDRTAMELVGEGVKLVGADEVVAAGGERAKSTRASKASAMFVNGFTKKYPEIARKTPVYAQLRNLIDISVAAAFIHQEDFYGKSGWKMEVFGSEDKLPVQTYQTPVQVDTVVTAIQKGNHLMTPIGGGVQVEAQMALNTDNLLPDEGNQVEKARSETRLDHLKEGQWWWD